MNNLPIASANNVVSYVDPINSEFDKYNAFLKEALSRCADLKEPYDRPTDLPLTPKEVEKFCDAAAHLGLPVIYVGNYNDSIPYYAAYPTFNMLQEIEKNR